MNPYLELSPEAQEDQFSELQAERTDILNDLNEVIMRITINNEHRGLLLRAMGVTLLPCVSAICGEYHESTLDEPLASVIDWPTK